MQSSDDLVVHFNVLFMLIELKRVKCGVYWEELKGAQMGYTGNTLGILKPTPYFAFFLLEWTIMKHFWWLYQE